MRVLHFYPNALRDGGYPRDIRWLAGAMASEGVDVSLVANPGDSTDGLGAATIVASKKFGAVLPTVDVVHVWGLFQPAHLWPLLQVGRRASLVISPLTQLSEVHFRRRRWKKVPYFWLWRAASNRAEYGMHFFSPHEAREALARLRPITSFEASSGVFEAPLIRRTEHLGDYLLFMGRNDVHHKGLDILVNAYAEAIRGGLSLPLVIAGQGQGDSRSYLERAIAVKGLSGFVSLVGPVSEDRKWTLLAEARALVFLSRWDGPPRPIREAISVGTPVIVSDGTNMAALVEHFGAGCRTGPGVESAALTLSLAEDREVVRGWQRGVLGLRRELAWESVARTYLQGYDQVLRALGRTAA